MDATQTNPEQSGPQSDSLVGSIMKPIVLDDASDQNDSAKVDSSPSRSSIIIATQPLLEQNWHYPDGLVGSVTNPITLDDTSDQESSAAVYPLLNGSTASSSSHLKRKRLTTDDYDPNRGETNAESYFEGLSDHNSLPSPKRAVRPSCVNRVTIRKLWRDSDRAISEDPDVGYKHEEEVRRQRRLRKLYARGEKLRKEIQGIWSEIDDLEGKCWSDTRSDHSIL